MAGTEPTGQGPEQRVAAAGGRFAQALAALLAAEAPDTRRRIEDWLSDLVNSAQSTSVAGGRSGDEAGWRVMLQETQSLYWAATDAAVRDRETRGRTAAAAQARRAAEEKKQQAAEAAEAAARAGEAAEAKASAHEAAEADRVAREAERRRALAEQQRRADLAKWTERQWNGSGAWAEQRELPLHSPLAVDVLAARRSSDDLLLRGLRVDALRLVPVERKQLLSGLGGPEATAPGDGGGEPALPALGGLPALGAPAPVPAAGMSAVELLDVLRQQAAALVEVVTEAAEVEAGLRWLSHLPTESGRAVDREAVGRWRSEAEQALGEAERALGTDEFVPLVIKADGLLAEMVPDPVPDGGSWWRTHRDQRKRTVVDLLAGQQCEVVAKSAVNHTDRIALRKQGSIASERRSGPLVLWWIRLGWQDGARNFPGRCVLCRTEDGS